MFSKWHKGAAHLAAILCFGLACQALYAQKLLSDQITLGPALAKIDTSKPTAKGKLDSPKKRKISKKKKQAKKRTAFKNPLPSLDNIMEAKFSALEQEEALLKSRLAALEKEVSDAASLYDTVLGNFANFEVSFDNNAPKSRYKINSLSLELDGSLLSKGRPVFEYSTGLNPVYDGKVPEGCHELTVKVIYERVTDTLFSRFFGPKIKPVETIVKKQVFIAKAGYKVAINVEGFEQENIFKALLRGPAVRFNTWVKPNFVKSAPIVSLNQVVGQGNVEISFKNQDAAHYQLHRKTLFIDGLEVFVEAAHNEKNKRNIVYDAPIKAGKHSLTVELFFMEKKWVRGGIYYNYKMTFSQEFYVAPGVETKIVLNALPKEGYRSDRSLPKARSSITLESEQNEKFFPKVSRCSELDFAEVSQPHQEDQSTSTSSEDVNDNVSRIKEQEDSNKAEEAKEKEQENLSNSNENEGASISNQNQEPSRNKE